MILPRPLSRTQTLFALFLKILFYKLRPSDVDMSISYPSLQGIYVNNYNYWIYYSSSKHFKSRLQTVCKMQFKWLWICVNN